MNTKHQHTSKYEYTASLQRLQNQSQDEKKLSGAANEIITPLKANAWEQALAAHPDMPYVSYILNGIHRGFHIGFDRKLHRAVGEHRCM